MSKQQTKFVRLKPYNKRKGHFLRRYTVQRKRFIQARWYEVPERIALFLEDVMSRPDRPNDPDSVPAFNICDSKKEARALMRREKKAAERASASNPQRMGVLTTGDLRGDQMREVDMDEREDDTPDYEDAEETAAEKDDRRRRALTNLNRAKEKRGTGGRKPPAKKTGKSPAKKPAKKRETASVRKRREAREAAKARRELDAADWEEDKNEEPEGEFAEAGL